MDINNDPDATTTSLQFEPLDILNFEAGHTALHEKDMNEMDIDEEFATMEGRAPLKGSVVDDEGQAQFSAREQPRFESPPPDEYEEEPEGWEEELSIGELRVVTQRLESQSGSVHTQAKRTNGFTSLSDTSKTGGIRAGSSSAEVSFGPSDIFDTAVASSSKPALPAPHTPSFEPLDSDIFGPTLEPLYAETASGRMIKFKRRSKPTVKKESNEVGNSAGVSHLLGQPLHHLLADVQELKSHERAMRMQRQYDEEAGRHNPGEAGPSSMSMWVDKYRPKRFSDLLGDDRIHREVLSWLKEWDRCVFKRANAVKKRRADEENPYTDILDRPKDRILLLSGPPGLGKTTLAHIIARQAGYKTLEINASDDRSAATVSTRIKNAIEAGSGLASEGRPTCVVIDEIDGAGGGGDFSFVKSLIKLIQDVPARRRTNTPAKPLRRPIICICNDLYANTLRPLRPFARVVRFRQPQSQLLVKRLRDICGLEKLDADLRVLTMLVEMTTGDVRSCLNTLQFIKSKSAKVTPEAIKTSSIGLKDSGTSLQTVWNNLFIPIAAKARRKQSGIDDGKYVNRLVDDVQSCGDYDKLVQGLFEHYPKTKPLDASMLNLNKMHDWIGYYDAVSGRVNERMEWELAGYLPYAVVPWYCHMAAPANSSRLTEWPKADYESYQTRTVNEEIAGTLKKTMPGILRSLFPTTTLLTELLPLLMRILTPPLRPVNANIVKASEKATLSRLVELMIPLGLSFWQEKGENGQPMMRLEPPIDVFVHYEGKRAEDIAASRFGVRQLIAQAMDAELARRRGGVTEENSGVESLKGMYGVIKKGGADSGARPEAIATDFFGRVIAPKLCSLPADTADRDVFTESVVNALAPPAKRFRAMYKFNEGSSSAVRKNVKMSEMM